MLEWCAVDRWDGAALGVLYDTGNGWPAAVFEGGGAGAGATGGSTVAGCVVVVEADDLASLFAELDEMEGVATIPDPALDPYVRTQVLVIPADPGRRDPILCWVYDATRIGHSWSPITAWTDQHER